MQRLKNILIFIFAGVLLFPAASFGIAEPGNATYSCQPIFQVNAVPPNIMVILDNSGSINSRAYSGNYAAGTSYYGYFEPDASYYYTLPANPAYTNSGYFVRVDGSSYAAYTNGPWSGNFLNFLTMRKVDVIRKVMMGGKRDTLASTIIKGHDSSNTQTLNSTVKAPDGGTPWDNPTSTYYFYFVGYTAGKFVYYTKTTAGGGYANRGYYNIWVEKDAALEPGNFENNELAGVIQKIGTRARWGNAWFNDGQDSSGENGGDVANIIDSGSSHIETVVTNIMDKDENSATPLAEALYTAVQYFKQEDIDGTLANYPTGLVPIGSNANDPYHDGAEFVSCAKSFVILLTDGLSTRDAVIPAAIKNYADSFDTFVAADDGTDCDENAETGCEFADGGTDYLKDVAYYARFTDLRSATVGDSPISGDQNVVLYTVLAFENDTDAQNLLKEAAKNGGYTERDGTDGPSSTSEWDEDNNGVPDTYYEASDGALLETKLLTAINDILARAASGTAVSVLATSGEGQGSLVQAFFKPQVTVGDTDYEWLGYLKSMWVDSKGNLREDTNTNRTLDIATDKVIVHFSDASGDTKIKRFNVSSGSEYPDTSGTADETVEIDAISAIWEAGELLAERSAAERKIFTYIDKDNDDVVDEAGNNPFDDSDEVVRFHTASAAAIKPYLGVQDNTTWEYLKGSSANNHDNRVTNLIEYIRGNDISGLRPRTFDYDDDSTDETWKLGDIIHSTPVTVAKPPDNYHIIYANESYQDFYDAFKDRENVVYVGANDGMLHAFTSWKYNSTNLQYTDPYPGDASGDTTFITDETANNLIGSELWAYIPQALLPHLKWLPSTTYSHAYYVDMKPKIFDAQILPLSTHYTDTTGATKNWGTFLLVGLNLGGGHIQAEDDFDYDGGTADTVRDFYPSYVLLDVTEPRAPRVMWERSYDGLQASASTPVIIKVKQKWFAVFGSGPSGCEGESTQSGKVFVVDLDDGDPYQLGTDDWRFVTGESNAFMNSPVALDKGLNFNVDAVYFGETYEDPGNADHWLGKVYKVTIPRSDTSSPINYDDTYVSDTNNTYSDDPKHTYKPWQFSVLFDATRPVTASLSLSLDTLDNVWIYSGTGRYLNDLDKDDTDTQYFFGIKDPFFNQGLYEASTPVYYHSYSNTKTLVHADLLNTDNLVITDAGKVYDDSTDLAYGTTGKFSELLTDARAKDGWIRSMTGGERMLSKPTLLGGIVFAPSFIPNTLACGFGGDSYLSGVYFETGTAFYKSVFSSNPTDVYTDDGGGTHEQVVDKISLGSGKSSSLAVHAGAEEGAKGFIQQSTGNIVSESLTPALTIKSGLTSWQEK